MEKYVQEFMLAKKMTEYNKYTHMTAYLHKTIKKEKIYNDT